MTDSLDSGEGELRRQLIELLLTDSNMSISSSLLDDLVALIVKSTHQAVEKARAEMMQQFIKKFCNDHNNEIRWLRGVALDETDLLEQILVWFSEIASAQPEKDKPS